MGPTTTCFTCTFTMHTCFSSGSCCYKQAAIKILACRGFGLCGGIFQGESLRKRITRPKRKCIYVSNKITKLYPIECVPFCAPINSACSPTIYHLSSQSNSGIFANLMAKNMVSRCNFNLHFLMMNGVVHLFLCIRITYFSPFVNSSILCLFFYWVAVLYSLNF